ncbi:hypothetical protein [Vibrio crassostreae]|uniref:hypothetical protein n=1 Tax=Vibrio crassostreae TaxID=246167 RepID=UPI001B30B8DF|nr:hypothetical protein [Vibrio crassostreae]
MNNASIDQQIKTLGAEMQHLEDEHGVGACIEAAEAQYQEMFRGEAYPLKNAIAEDFTFNEAVSELSSGRILNLFIKQHRYFKEIPNLSHDEGYAESFYDEFGWWSAENKSNPLIVEARKQITPETLVVDICNYKGEGEGIELFDDNRHLRIFKGKFAY